MFTTRRSFLKTTTAAASIAGLTAIPAVHAAGDNTIKLGLVGCGGRGTGAVRNALEADPNTKVAAVCDAFPEKAQSAVDNLRKEERWKDRILATHETAFSGLESYKQVIDLCDVVLLCEVPHFRPLSLRYAVEKGKHVFCEKPVAVDGAGIKSVLESAKIAKEKKLNIVAGLCWRYDHNIRAMMNWIADGAIGDVLSTRVSYMTGRLWDRPRQANDTEMMYQVRNWYNFTWLSGDFNVEQAIHSVDKLLWSFGDEEPVSAFGSGGRMVRTEYPKAGDIYDSIDTVYDFGGGRTGYLFCRQINKCYSEVTDHIIGTKGYATTKSGGFGGCTINVKGSEPVNIKLPGNMYVIEHQYLLRAVRGNIPYRNDGVWAANSTMAGIMGRQVARTGKQLTRQQALDLEEPMSPSGYTWDATPPTMPDEQGRYKVEIPGSGYLYHEVKR
ncbi:MAG: Gfo/Idh/MocA family oxidoreductase [Planctomycetaceae bacterium]|jgi:predicted dehydrogenase|nr:Gfo/Idh/MocA family oxidoreductase [Planctomycetaceae bacterium]